MKKASCENKQVTCEGTIIPDAIILGKGIEKSEGVLLFDEKLDPVYVPDTQPDMSEVLDLMNKLATACANITTIVQGAPVAPTNKADFTNLSAEINEKKEKLI